MRMNVTRPGKPGCYRCFMKCFRWMIFHCKIDIWIDDTDRSYLRCMSMTKPARHAGRQDQQHGPMDPSARMMMNQYVREYQWNSIGSIMKSVCGLMDHVKLSRDVWFLVGNEQLNSAENVLLTTRQEPDMTKSLCHQ